MNRYLVNFLPKKSRHQFADILVIGGGLAGMRAALEVDPNLQVIVITKDVVQQSNSNYAQGGIAGVFDPEDKIEFHVRDTLIAGANLCDEKVVERVIRQAPDRIRELIDLGTEFDRQKLELKLGREGGHSHNRILHARGDATGAEIMRAVISKIEQQSNITVVQNAFTLDLLTHEGVCRGAIIHEGAELVLVWAKQTILCTGGAGQLFRETTNPAVATGDGLAMAYRAGVEVRDMEFMQFHPTVLYIAGSSRSLVSEAVRGEGAHLVDVGGYRFMGDYDSRMELAPRDIVSLAIVSQMEKTNSSSAFLSLKHLDPVYIRDRFPGIGKAVAEFGLDITCDPIPVRPGAHYMLGGVTVDEEGRTSLPGLWAAGEVTSSGLHGANRLASNSLLEGLVYGVTAGRGSSQLALQMPDNYQIAPLSHQTKVHRQSLDLSDIRNSLKSLLWRSVGVRREGQSIRQALSTIQGWKRYVLDQTFDNRDGWELQNMLVLGELMARAALQRTESRGVHWRSDYPDTDDEHWRRHIVFRNGELSTQGLPLCNRAS
jgi:L-aspartate oxidase